MLVNVIFYDFTIRLCVKQFISVATFVATSYNQALPWWKEHIKLASHAPNLTQIMLQNISC